MAEIGLGVIGAGKHGLRYLNHARSDVPGLRLAAISRRDPAAGETLARDLGCRFHAEWRALVADPAVHAVAAVVPPSMHRDVAAAVAAARKPFLIEKPLAPSGADARAIVRCVRAAGIPVLMAHTLRWNPVVHAVQNRIGALGELRALVLNQRFEPSSLAWLDDPQVAAGGIILHTGVHSFDLVRHLTGREVRRVWCRTASTHTKRTEDNFAATFELVGSPALVGVSGCRDTTGRSGLIDVACTKGQIVADHQLHWAYEAQGLTRTPLDLGEALPTVREVLRSFVALVERGEPPPVSLEDGARAALIVEACRAAARGDGPVDVAPLDA